MSAIEHDLMSAEPDIFYSETGALPFSAILGLHNGLTLAAKFGKDRILKLLKAIDPPPEIDIQICVGIVGPDGERFDTAPDTVIVVLFYPDQTRCITIQLNANDLCFVPEHPTIQ